MIVPFSSKGAYTSKFEDAQTKIWRSFNDDQHMWVCGSFFQFSAGEGWENLRGFDISPEGSKKLDDEGPLTFLKGGANTNLYVVQADRAMQAEEIDPADSEQSFRSKMWMLPVMENRDKILVAPRLRRTYELLPNSEFLAKQVDYLPAVYESLIKMDQFAFTFGMQAQLAVNLIADPDFCAHNDQLNALKQGKCIRKTFVTSDVLVLTSWFRSWSANAFQGILGASRPTYKRNGRRRQSQPSCTPSSSIRKQRPSARSRTRDFRFRHETNLCLHSESMPVLDGV